ncbi:MAG: ABC transporter permease [Acidobacteria bacterium]|nr:MAG: ABC transporter permease [Acidobacteriota bacterium]
MRRPPRLAEALLERLVPRNAYGDAILGDLSEEYHARAESRLSRTAAIWYWAVSLRVGMRIFWNRKPERRRQRKGDRPMTTFLRDLQHAARGLVANPTFSVMVIVTLALGIGANAAIFSIVDALVLRPFPVPELDRLVALFEVAPNSNWDRGGVAPANFLDWEAQSEHLDKLVANEWWDVNMTGGDSPERLQGSLVTAGFLDILGVKTQIGRTLALDAEDFGARTAVLSHALWTRRFAADPDVLGQTILLNGEGYDVVGVAEEGFNYPFGTEIWAPLWFDAETTAVRDSHYLQVIGQLAPEATVEDARAELDLVAQRLEQEYPNTNSGRHINTMALGRAVVDIGAPAFLLMWQATSVFVLLIACVNVANLILARGAERKKELALHLALGAGRGRVIRRLLTENMLLALVGALLALPLAGMGVELMRSNMPAHIAKFVVGWDQIDLDWHVLGFTAIVAVATALVFGLIPALQASRPDLTAALREGGRGHSDGHARQRGRNMLVVFEVAMALTLLVASGLSIQGTMRMADADQGYDPDGVMTMEISLPEGKYEEDEARLQFYRSVLSGVRALPGVVAADAVNILPSSGSNTSRNIDIEGKPVENPSERQSAHFRIATAGYLETMRIPIVQGRAFGSEDRSDTAMVAVVSERFARRSWPGEDPLGRRFRYGTEETWLSVIGVSGDVLHDWFLQEPQPTFYVPMEQAPRLGLFLAIRTLGAPEEVTAGVRAQVLRVDADQPIFNARTMRTLLSERLIGLKYAATVMGIFGAIALILSAVGIYGVMAYSVSRRTHEIGLRVALGAAHRDVLKLTVGRALRTTALGIGIGLVLAFFIGRLMESTFSASFSSTG